MKVRVCQFFEVCQHEFANLSLPCEGRSKLLTTSYIVPFDFSYIILTSWPNKDHTLRRCAGMGRSCCTSADRGNSAVFVGKTF